jgi:predicted nucleic acid-binding protein
VTEVVLDTNVISELVRAKPEPKVLDFLKSCDEPIVSSIVFHEIAYGIERLRDAAKRMRLELFLKGIKEMYQGRIVDVDVALAELAGRLRARATRSGWVLSQMDSLIAATAIEKGAKLATRNVGDFERLQIPLIDPWLTDP